MTLLLNYASFFPKGFGSYVLMTLTQGTDTLFEKFNNRNGDEFEKHPLHYYASVGRDFTRKVCGLGEKRLCMLVLIIVGPEEQRGT